MMGGGGSECLGSATQYYYRYYLTCTYKYDSYRFYYWV